MHKLTLAIITILAPPLFALGDLHFGISQTRWADPLSPVRGILTTITSGMTKTITMASAEGNKATQNAGASSVIAILILISAAVFWFLLYTAFKSKKKKRGLFLR